jgi:hypothetical protein
MLGPFPPVRGVPAHTCLPVSADIPPAQPRATSGPFCGSTAPSASPTCVWAGWERIWRAPGPVGASIGRLNTRSGGPRPSRTWSTASRDLKAAADSGGHESGFLQPRCPLHSQRLSFPALNTPSSSSPPVVTVGLIVPVVALDSGRFPMYSARRDAMSTARPHGRFVSHVNQISPPPSFIPSPASTA